MLMLLGVSAAACIRIRIHLFKYKTTLCCWLEETLRKDSLPKWDLTPLVGCLASCFCVPLLPLQQHYMINGSFSGGFLGSPASGTSWVCRQNCVKSEECAHLGWFHIISRHLKSNHLSWSAWVLCTINKNKGDSLTA